MYEARRKMMKKEEISVILPIHNVGIHLQTCLESISNQTFDDFLVIAIDDASTDDTFEILSNHAKHDLRFQVWKNPYRIGAARTRNIGIQLACGKYLSILDADDFFELDFFSTMFLHAENEKADIAICNLFWHDNDTGEDVPNKHPHRFWGENIECAFSGDRYPEHILGLFLSAPFLKLYRREFVLDNNLAFQDLPNCNDVYFNAMSLALAERIVYVKKNLIHYRKNISTSITASRHKNPYCIYHALKKVQHSLIESQKFMKYKKSFFSLVVNHVKYYLSSIPDDLQPSLINFYSNSVFECLNMKDLKVEDFSNPIAFSEWYYLSHLQKEVFHVTDFSFFTIPYQCFFNELKSCEGHVALWGFGVLGRTFLKMAMMCHFEIMEIYDINESLWDRRALPPILPFLEHAKAIDTIIVTNEEYSFDVLVEIRKLADNIRVIDFSAYQSGIDLMDCEVDYRRRRCYDDEE